VPDGVNLSASIERVGFADKCGAFNLGLDAAESIGARNAFEQMLAYQMAGAYKRAMEMLARAAEHHDPAEQVRFAFGTLSGMHERLEVDASTVRGRAISSSNALLAGITDQQTSNRAVFGWKIFLLRSFDIRPVSGRLDSNVGIPDPSRIAVGGASACLARQNLMAGIQVNTRPARGTIPHHSDWHRTIRCNAVALALA